MKKMKIQMPFVSAMFAALSVFAEPTSVVWDAAKLEATVTLPEGEHVVPADLWLGDATGGAKAAVVNVIGSGATAVFTNTYASGLALLAEDARIRFAAGVTARTFVNNYQYYGLLGDETRARLDVGMVLAEGSVFEVPASVAHQTCLYLGVGGLTLTGATVVDRRFAGGNTTSGDVCATPFYNVSARIPRLSGLVTARACSTPSRIIAKTLVVRGGTVFEVESGAELRLEAQLSDDFDDAVGRIKCGFVKRGAGKLVLARGCSLSGRVTIKEGTVQLAEGASLREADLEVYDGAKVLLSDGSTWQGANTVAVPAAMRRAAIHLDASVFAFGTANTINESEYFLGTKFLNLGAAGGAFKKRYGNISIWGSSVACKRGFKLNNVAWKLEGFTNNTENLTVFQVRRGYSATYKAAWAFANMAYLRENPTVVRQDNVWGEGAADWGKAAAVEMTPISASQTRLVIPKNHSGSNKFGSVDATSTLDQADPMVEMMGLWRGDPETKDSDVAIRQFSLAAANCITVNAATTVTVNPYVGDALNHDYLMLGNRVKSADTHDSGGYMTGMYLSEFVAFFEKLSESEITNVVNYLQNKWFDPSMVGQSGTKDPVAVEVPNGASAGLSQTNAHALVKSGAGDLCVAAPGCVATNGVGVKGGALAFSDRAVTIARVWIDPSDEESLLRDANGMITNIVNRGASGGAFAPCRGQSTYATTTGLTYGGTRKMLEMDNSAYDLETTVVRNNRTNDACTVFAVLAEGMDSPALNSMFLSLTSPCSETPGVKPPYYITLMSLGPTHGTYSRGVYGTMSAHHPSVIQWWGDEVWKSDNPECFNRPVVAMFEDSRGLFRARIATRRGIEAGDTGNKCETTTGMPDHHYGFVRLGCGVYADKHPADFVKGGIGEVIVFDEPLSPSEKTSVYEYLRDKWLYGMDVMPPPIVGGADVTAARPDLLLSDGTTLAYTGVASNRVSAVTLDAGAQVTVRLDRVPGRDETVDFLGYEELNLNGGRVEVGSENARKHKIGYSNSWMQILRNVPGLLLLFR